MLPVTRSKDENAIMSQKPTMPQKPTKEKRKEKKTNKISQPKPSHT